jgi:thiol-disulfide isomerase/thioredoxin
MKLRCCWTVAIMLLTFSVMAAAQAPDPAGETLKHAAHLVAAGKYDDALKAYKDANKRKKGNCAPCYLGMAVAFTKLGDAKSALESSEKALKVASDDLARAQGHSFRGDALMALAGGQKNKLTEAENEFRQALQLEPDNPAFHLKLGIALAKQMRDAEAVAEFKESSTLELHGEVADLARALAVNPRRAREPFAPDFRIQTLNGETVSLSSFAGKVVVLDFWATWCPPCRAAIPDVKDLIKKYGSDQLVIISLSWDEDEKTWRDFIAKHQMNWIHARDSESQISNTLGVRSVPTYLVIDGDGFIKERIVGTNPQQSLAYRLREKLQSMPQLAKK